MLLTANSSSCLIQKMNQQIKRKIHKLPKPLEAVFGFIELLFSTLLAVSLVFTYLLRIVEVSGDSMSDTLETGDKVIMTAFCNNPKQGDIVVFYASDAVTLDENGGLVFSAGIRQNLMKRVIAAEGQTVDFDFSAGKVFVDGKVLDEPYISGLTHSDQGAFTGKYPVTVPEGYVFVMGDNRRASIDSRAKELGFVAADDIIGKVVFGISPFGKIDG